VLAAASIPGLLTNRAELYDSVDTEGGAEQAFIQAWSNRHGSSSLHTADLLELAETAGVDVESRTDKGRAIKLGNVLKKLRKQTFAVDGSSVRVDQPKPKHDEGGALWRLRLTTLTTLTTQTADAGNEGPSAEPEAAAATLGQGPTIPPSEAPGSSGSPGSSACPRHPVTPRPDVCDTCRGDHTKA
jgi:hypothetical protein